MSEPNDRSPTALEQLRDRGMVHFRNSQRTHRVYDFSQPDDAGRRVASPSRTVAEAFAIQQGWGPHVGRVFDSEETATRIKRIAEGSSSLDVILDYKGRLVLDLRSEAQHIITVYLRATKGEDSLATVGQAVVATMEQIRQGEHVDRGMAALAAAGFRLTSPTADIDGPLGVPSLFGWRYKDSRAAQQEGWDIFDSTKYGVRIERIEDPEDASGNVLDPVFEDDDEAFNHVVEAAKGSNPLHQKALVVHTYAAMSRQGYAWPVSEDLAGDVMAMSVSLDRFSREARECIDDAPSDWAEQFEVNPSSAINRLVESVTAKTAPSERFLQLPENALTSVANDLLQVHAHYFTPGMKL